jgi:hypothetical protein
MSKNTFPDQYTLDDDLILETLVYWGKYKNVAPQDHYFHTYFAYACLTFNLVEQAEDALVDFFSFNNKGHIEFNKYALICIYSEFKNTLKQNLLIKIENYIFSDTYSVNAHTATGNNWLFLRTLVHLKLFCLNGNRNEFNNFEFYLDFILDFEHQNMFFDYPPKSLLGGYSCKASPVAYSVKMLSVILEIYQLLNSKNIISKRVKELKELIDRSVPEHMNFISPDGETLYYGRSDNTLFGYANLLYILNSLSSGDSVNNMKSACISYIKNNFILDEKIYRCMPYEGFKDQYIHDSVYIAYFLAKYIQSKNIQDSILIEYKESFLPQTGVIENSVGYIIKGKNYFYFLSSTGSNIKEKGTDFYSYRYSGLTFLKYYNLRNNRSSLLSINRKNIAGISSEIPFIPKISYPFLEITYLYFERVALNDDNESDFFTISGYCVPAFVITNAFIVKLINKISRSRLGGRVSRLVGLWMDKFLVNRQLERRVMVEKNLGEITIQDNYTSARKVQYVIPNDWLMEADQFISLKKFSDCEQYQINSDCIVVKG